MLSPLPFFWDSNRLHFVYLFFKQKNNKHMYPNPNLEDLVRDLLGFVRRFWAQEETEDYQLPAPGQGNPPGKAGKRFVSGDPSGLEIIGVLLVVLLGNKSMGFDSWLTWWFNHLPGKRIRPRTLMMEMWSPRKMSRFPEADITTEWVSTSGAE